MKTDGRKSTVPMGPRECDEASVPAVDVLHGRPGGDDAVGRAEGEVVEVLGFRKKYMDESMNRIRPTI